MKYTLNKHLCFDRIMFKFPLRLLLNHNNDLFVISLTPSGTFISKIFNQKKPYLLYIKIDYLASEVLINVSSKILRSEYNKLINTTTFNTLINHINQLGLIQIDPNDVLGNSDVLDCDVTEDKYETLTKKRICALQLCNRSNVWEATSSKHGITFVKTGLSLTLYDKHQEIIDKPKRYDVSLFDIKFLLENFKGKTRYELKIKSRKLIRESFTVHKVSCVTLHTLLNSTEDPIDKVYTTLFGKDLNLEVKNLELKLENSLEAKTRAINHYKNLLLCESCDYDIKKVATLLKGLISSNSNISSLIKPYKAIIYNHLYNSSVHKIDT